MKKPTKPTLPTLLSIASSVLTHYGLETVHPTLPIFDELLAKDNKNIVVMLFDGLGSAILERHLPPEAFLRKHHRQNLDSVFPPTTTAATVSVESGLSPIEHGWLGWSLYFKELDANVSIFPNTLSGTDGISAADYNVAGKYIAYSSIRDRINTSGSADAFTVSPFSAYCSKSVEEICDTVQTLCASAGKKYIYTYWHQPDYDMHDLGVGHERIAEHCRHINTLVEELCGRLADTLVVITADHGLVDTDWFYLSDYPDLLDCLVRPPSIESRAASFFVKEERKEDFCALFPQYFGKYFRLLTKKQVLAENVFGSGTPHPRADGFIGDFLAVATGSFSIAANPPKEGDSAFKAAHAGLTTDEMTVPFIAVECPKRKD